MKTEIEKIKEIDEDAIYNLYNIYKNSYLVGLENYIKKLKLDKKNKIVFYVTILDHKSIKNDKVKAFLKSIICNLLFKTINDNKIEFLDLLKDSNFRNKITSTIKKYPGLLNVNKELLPIISSLPEFKKDVLSSKKFKSKLEICGYDFFNSLPKNYGYLVAYYNEHINNYDEKLEKLYNRFFKKHLSEEERFELMQIQNEMKTKQIIIETSNYYKVSSLEHCLKNIILDSNYFNILKNISKKSNIKLLDIIEFAKKYDKTKIFDELNNKDFNYTLENKEKIEYLIKSEKIDSIDSIKNLNDTSLEKLRKMPRVYKKNIRILSTGGPQATKNKKQFLPDGDFRHIRRINTDGSVQIKTAENIGHAKAVKESYKELDFGDACKTAFERAKTAATVLGTITLIIEGDLCIMITPKKLTQSQFESLKSIISRSTRNSKINTVICDFKKNEDIFVYDIDALYGAITVKKDSKSKYSRHI